MPPAPAPRPTDQRRTPRLETTLRARVFPGGHDCLIEDFSRHGGRLRFRDSPPPPDDIVIVVWSTGVAIEAIKRWGRGAEAGYRFESRFDLRGVVPDRLADVKAVWRSRRAPLNRAQLRKCPAIVGYRGAPSAVKLS